MLKLATSTMPIKDKNGNVYKIRGPNPMMKDQCFWDIKNVVLFNMKWKEIVYKDKNITVSKVIENFVERANKEIKLIASEPEKINDEIKLIATEPEVFNITKDEKIKMRKKTFHCLPVIFKEVIDDLYGETTGQYVYGEKYTFEAVPLETNDIFLCLWTQKNINKSSIILQKDNKNRWWQIQSSEPDSEGFIVTASISSLNPSFSD